MIIWHVLKVDELCATLRSTGRKRIVLQLFPNFSLLHCPTVNHNLIGLDIYLFLHVLPSELLQWTILLVHFYLKASGRLHTHWRVTLKYQEVKKSTLKLLNFLARNTVYVRLFMSLISIRKISQRAEDTTIFKSYYFLLSLIWICN
jgi:Zn-dependent M16 (insulinase) family peptidase